MADSLPSPPSTRESTPHVQSEHPSNDKLVRRLDDLLGRYLEILDEYTALREQLSKTFADGFFSLAHAQRNSNLGPGRRYGQDGYDDRMKALRRVDIRNTTSQHNKPEEPDLLRRSSSTTHTARPNVEYQIKTYNNKAVEGEDAKQVQDPARQRVNEKTNTKVSGSIEDSARKPGSKGTDLTVSKPKIDPAYRDPITWYGILVPPALRQSQKHFSASVETVIPRLVSSMSTLRFLESQIWTVRTELGIQTQHLEGASELPHRPFATDSSAK